MHVSEKAAATPAAFFRSKKSVLQKNDNDFWFCNKSVIFGC